MPASVPPNVKPVPVTVLGVPTGLTFLLAKLAVPPTSVRLSVPNGVVVNVRVRIVAEVPPLYTLPAAVKRPLIVAAVMFAVVVSVLEAKW